MVLLLDAVTKSNKRLVEVSSHIGAVEDQLKTVEKEISTPSSGEFHL